MKITYMELINDYIIEQTEKAYALDYGMGNLNAYGSHNDIFKWIPKSLTVCKDNKIYVSYMAIQDNRLWDYVNKNSNITVDNGVKRASGKELILKRLNRELKDNKDTTLVVWDNKQFNSYKIDKFELYEQENNKANKEFNNFEKYGIVAVLKIKDNKIIDSLVQDKKILNKKCIELLDLVIDVLK